MEARKIRQSRTTEASCLASASGTSTNPIAMRTADWTKAIARLVETIDLCGALRRALWKVTESTTPTFPSVQSIVGQRMTAASSPRPDGPSVRARMTPVTTFST